MNKEDTYNQPEHGWTCFFCGETFTNYGSARDHFGERPPNIAACVIKAGHERGLVMALRKAQSLLTEREGWVQQGYCLVNRDRVMYWGPENISSEHMEHWPALETLQYHERQKQWHIELLYSAAPKQEEPE